MTRIMALPILCATVVMVAAAEPVSAQRNVAERVSAAPDGFVRVQNIAGSVKLIGWDRDSIAVTGTVHDTPGAPFELLHGEGGVKLGLWDTSVERAEPSHIEVRVPARSRIWIRTGSATVFVDGVTGTLDVTSVGGDIEVRGGPGEVFAESMTGRLTIDVRSPLARVKTVTGSILVRGAIADATATSVSGNVLIEDAVVERGSFESVDGELRFVGQLRSATTLDFVTHAGAVEFLLPAATNAEFRFATFEGGLRSEFKTPIRTSRSKIKGSEHSFVLGEGGARVNVRTFRGRVVVRSR